MIEQLRSILDSLPMMIAYKDTNNNVITVNKSAAEFMGKEINELSNIPLEKIFPNDYDRYYRYDLEVIKSKKVKSRFVEKHEIFGRKIFVETSIIPIINKKNDVENLIIFMNDITKKHHLEIKNEKNEKLLYHQNKMAAMGEMIENIAHQWRQPLSAISTSATGIKLRKEMNLLSDKDLVESMTTINETVQYLSQTINDFRNFINPSKNEYSRFNISNTIEKTLKLTNGKRLAKKIEVIKNINDIEIVSLENELVQVLINILNNAIDVLSERSGDKLIFINIFVQNSHLNIHIKDNGNGVESDILDKIFDPYFTTKHKSQGTGIGLFMSQEIVSKLLNGKVSVENEIYLYDKKKYTGANFKIELPL